MDDETELSGWATAYIQAQQVRGIDADDPLWWAISRFWDEDAEISWLAILEILRQAPSAQVLSVLAAGPLEDLIDQHGPQFIERIELQARRDPAFRQLLRGVWTSSTPAIWSRVETACAR